MDQPTTYNRYSPALGLVVRSATFEVGDYLTDVENTITYEVHLDQDDKGYYLTTFVEKNTNGTITREPTFEDDVRVKNTASVLSQAYTVLAALTKLKLASWQY
jgi:hypothetical protein